MEQDYSKVGVFNVDGQWATRIRYDVTLGSGRVKEVRLQFLNGRQEVAAAVLPSEAARELLGEKNFAVMRKAVERKAKNTAEPISGDLKGRQLEYRHVSLERAGENSIEEQPRRVKTATEEAAPQRGVPEAARQVDAVPGWVKDRFVVVDNQYHFPDRTLAFTDQGSKLKAVTDNLEVVRSLVAIAEAREWQALKVRGSEAFRRQVWREASRRSIEVEGYAPSALELAEAKQVAPKMASTKPVAGSTPLASAPRTATEKVQGTGRRDVLIGRLLDAGAAPYRFEGTAAMSYYVKVATDAGERTVWGVDLERAMAESSTQPKVGDTIGVENQGSRPVTLKSLQRDADGKAIDTTITANRHRWLVERTVYFEERAERSAAFANGAAAKRELAQQYPDLSGALVALWLGEQFAAKMIERPEDRERVIALVKDRLQQALERGETVDAPKLKQEVGQRLAAVGDDFDEVGQRARARTARREARTVDEVQQRAAPRAIA